MDIRAKYYANLRTGQRLYLCGDHITKVARRLDAAGHVSLKRGVRSIGSLSPYTPKLCTECRQQGTEPNHSQKAIIHDSESDLFMATLGFGDGFELETQRDPRLVHTI